MGQNFTDVCPLLDRPPGSGENYLQPVQADRNIELATRNLPPEVKEISTCMYTIIWNNVLQISGFMYECYVNGIRLSATYNNESSLTCAVNTGQVSDEDF